MDNVRLSIVHPTSEGGGSGRNKLKKNDNASTLRGKKSRGNKIKNAIGKCNNCRTYLSIISRR